LDKVDAATVLSEGLGTNEGYLPISAIVIAEAMDPDTGEIHLLHRHSGERPWAIVGMLQTVTDTLRESLQDDYQPGTP
jgi:hypothetical protein